MPLELVVEKLDSVPEGYRGEYVEKDGKFHLNVNGVPDVSKLNTALNSERSRAAELEKSIKDWAKLGKKPDEVEAMLTEERQKAEQALLKAGKVDEVVAARLAEAAKESNTKIDALTKREGSALATARKAVTDTGLTTALTKAKVTAEGIAALPKLLADRVQVDFDADHNVTTTIFAADGKSKMLNGDGTTATFDDLVKEAMKTFPSLFEGTGGGGGASPKGGKGGPKSMSRRDFDALSPTEKSAKMKEGWTLFD